MSQSPNSSLVQHTIELNYSNKKRSSSLKWIVVNIVLFLLFAYDLCCKCPGYTSALHYVEMCAAAVLAANVLQHAARLAAPRRAPPQQRLPGLPPSPRAYCAPDDPDASLSPRRAWRADASPPPSPPSPASPRPSRAAPDQFIADARSLAAYLRGQAERARAEPEAGRAPAPGAAHYQLSAPAAAAGADDAVAARAPQVWRRLQLDPQRLEQWNLNLRLWLHVTILQRLVRALEAADEALAASGLEARVGAASAERLRAAAAAGAGGAHGLLHSLPALLAYLEPFADQRYVVQRIRELATGGCLSGYRWNGGGSDWDDAKPTDAELVLHLLATYLDAQLPPAPAARAFSAAHLSSAPAPPPRHPRALAVHRLGARPPHYALALGDELVELERGRNNLLHTLLLFLAAAARREPPALRRLHLGRAGLNMLWIIGR